MCSAVSTTPAAVRSSDILHADCQILLTDAHHRGLIDGLDLPGVRVLDVGGDEWAALVAGAGPLSPYREVGPMDTFMLIFTSGTSGDPKAVQVPHFTVLVAGATLAERFRLTTSGRLLPVDAAVPLQRGAGGLERRGGVRRRHGPRCVLGLRACWPTCAGTA